MDPVTFPVPTIDDLMRSLGITEEEMLDDLLYPAAPWLGERAGRDGAPAARAA
jgi:hypothetical protein